MDEQAQRLLVAALTATEDDGLGHEELLFGCFGGGEGLRDAGANRLEVVVVGLAEELEEAQAALPDVIVGGVSFLGGIVGKWAWAGGGLGRPSMCLRWLLVPQRRI